MFLVFYILLIKWRRFTHFLRNIEISVNQKFSHFSCCLRSSSSISMASNDTSENHQHRPRQRNGPPPFRRQGRNPQPARQEYQMKRQPQNLSEKRKPVFVKVDQLKPGTNGHNLIVKVIDQKSVFPASSNLRPTRIAESLIGDENASILFTARNDQVDLMKPGSSVILRNAKIDMFKGSMRLVVDKWGLIEVTEPADFTVKEDNNLSLVEYELVNMVGE